MSEFELQYGEPLSDSDLSDFFWASYDASREHFDPIWDEANELYEAYYGNTLSDIDKQYLLDTKRPPISFNFVSGTIDTLVGSDMADKKEVVFKGTDLSVADGVKAEWLTQIVRDQMTKSRGLRHQSDSFFDMLITGYGFAEIFLDTSKVPVPVAFRRVHPWEVYPDPDASEDNLSDARFFIRRRVWEVEEVQAKWPSKAKEVQDGLAAEDIKTVPTPSIYGKFVRSEMPAKRRGVHVFDFLYKRYEPRVAVDDQETGETEILKPEEFEARQEEAVEMYKEQIARWESLGGPTTGEPPPSPEEFGVTEGHEFATEVYYRAHLLGNADKGTGVILDNKQLSVEMFPLRCVTGYRKKDTGENRVRFFGPAKKIFDPQLYLNKALGTWLDILARGSKGGGIINRDLVRGKEKDFIKNRTIPGMWSIVDGPITSETLQWAPVQTTPSGFERFLDLCIDAISRISLVTDWVKGTATQERSNVLISNLQQQAMTGLNPLFDPLGEFREKSGLLVAKLALKSFSDGQINKIIGEVDPVEGLTHESIPDPQTGEESLQPIMVGDPMSGERPITPADILRDTDPFTYDVAVDVGQASSNQKQAVWQTFVQTNLVPQLMEMGVPMETFLPRLFRYLPLPSSMADSMADEMEEQIEMQKKLRSEEGVIEMLSKMPAEKQIEIFERATQAQGDNQ